MTASPFKLDMYLNEQTAVLFAELQDVVCADIDFADCLPEQGQHKLCLGQICGVDFASSAADDYRYLATFSLTDRTIPSGYYRSVLITPVNGGLARLSDFRPEQHLVAVNELGSFSGAITFARSLLGCGSNLFPHQKITGSHAASLDCVARAGAMLASIDCVSFEMTTRLHPELRQNIRVLGFTTPFPGLPFVTSAQMPDDICQLMIERLLGFVEGERVKLWADRLGVAGIVRLSANSYQQMRTG